MADHGNGKLIPPGEVLEEELADQIERKVRADITERVLREAGLDDQVVAAIAAIKVPDGAVLAGEIAQLFEHEPDAEWRAHIEAVARKQTGAA